jgi:hypothetical protein
MANELNDRQNPGGETLNDRLRRAAAMTREQQQRMNPLRRQENTATVNSQHEPTRVAETNRVSEPSHATESTRAAESARAAETVNQPRPTGKADEPHRHTVPHVEEYETATAQPNGKNNGNSKKIGVLIALLVIAVLAIVYLTTTQHKQVAEQQQQIEQLQLANEQLQLSNEYDALNNEFAQYENQTSLLANDSIVQKYSAARAQVEKLLQELKNEKNKSAAQISKLKGEIATLKGILRTYVEQINTLNQENQELRNENQEVKARNEQLSQTVQTVEKNNKALNERMTLAEKLNVTGLNLKAINKKGKAEKKVSKARQLMVTFTIPQNNSTPVGEKTIFVRITNPEGSLLDGGGSFQFEGSTLAATARKKIEYAGEEIGGITIYWDVNTTLNAGDYTVELFCDNYRLVSRKFTLN